MEKLGLIITGQLRTFFSQDVQESFLNFITGLSQKYEIYACLVINESVIDYDSFHFLNKFVKEYKIIQFKKKKLSLENIITVLSKIESALKPNFKVETINRLEEKNKWLLSLEYQVDQIQQGIRELLKYNIVFDVMVKTRFDLQYKIPVLPYSNLSSLFPHSRDQEQRHIKLLEEEGIDSFEFFEDICNRMKNTSTFVYPPSIANLGFGGPFYLHKHFLSDNNSKIYMYWDWLLIGTYDFFYKYLDFWNIINNYEKLKSMFIEKEIYCFWNPEVFMLIFSFMINYNPIMYHYDGLINIKR